MNSNDQAAEEDVGGSTDGVASKVPMDGRKVGGRSGVGQGREGQEDDSTSSPQSLRGSSKRWMDGNSPPSDDGSDLLPLIKLKSSRIQKGKDKKTSKKRVAEKLKTTKKRVAETRGYGRDRELELPSSLVPTKKQKKSSLTTSSNSTTSTTSQETPDSDGLHDTDDENEEDKTAMAALDDDGGANDDFVAADHDSISFGDNNNGEDMSISDDYHRPSVRPAPDQSPSGSEDTNNETYKAALAALNRTDDVGAWKKLPFDDNFDGYMSTSDANDIPTSTIGEQPSIRQGKKHRKVSKSKRANHVLNAGEVDNVSESPDALEIELFESVEQIMNLNEQWKTMLVEEKKIAVEEAAWLARREQTLGNHADSGDGDNVVNRATKKKDTSIPHAKRRRENGDQSAITVAARSASWTDEEKRLYELGVQQCQNNWGKIASDYVKSRTAHQVREYARRCIGLSANSQRSNVKDVITPQLAPPLQDKTREQEQVQGKLLGESTATQLPVSTDIALSLPGKNEPKMLEFQTAMNDSNGDGVVAIRGGKSSTTAFSLYPDQSAHSFNDTETSYGGTATVSKDVDEDDDDDDVKAFITCNKCCLVFDSMNKANKHEMECTFTRNEYGIDTRPVHGRVFHDKHTLLQYMHHRFVQVNPLAGRDDKIYYCP